jgi:hypothetical protein
MRTSALGDIQVHQLIDVLAMNGTITKLSLVSYW